MTTLERSLIVLAVGLGAALLAGGIASLYQEQHHLRGGATPLVIGFGAGFLASGIVALVLLLLKPRSSS